METTVPLRELDPARAELVKLRSLRGRVAVGLEVAGAKVIRKEDQHACGRFGRSHACGRFVRSQRGDREH
jgi:hypothetical protein